MDDRSAPTDGTLFWAPTMTKATEGNSASHRPKGRASKRVRRPHFKQPPGRTENPGWTPTVDDSEAAMRRLRSPFDPEA